MATSALIMLIMLLSLTSVLAETCSDCSSTDPVLTSSHHKKQKQSPTPTLFPPLPIFNPPSQTKCSIDHILKLGLCLDVLGGLVHVGLGDAVENACCPVINGLLQLEAAVCLCTAINLKLLNLNIYIPLMLQVLVTCGKDPPPGYLCPEHLTR